MVDKSIKCHKCQKVHNPTLKCDLPCTCYHAREIHSLDGCTAIQLGAPCGCDWDGRVHCTTCNELHKVDVPCRDGAWPIEGSEFRKPEPPPRDTMPSTDDESFAPYPKWKCSKCYRIIGGLYCSECDGNHGVELNKAIKFDSGKPKYSLIPWDAIESVAEVFTIGARKYVPRNWEKGMAWSRIYDSTQRHLKSWFQDNQTLDPEGTGLRNLAQAAWGCLVLLAYEIRGIGDDDRPKTD